MKSYQSHKVVQAAPIMGYTSLGNYVNVEADNADGYECVSVPGDFFARGMPDLGDYLVRYQPDGYLSWSPKAVFEAGYSEVSEDKPSTWQERAVLELNELGVRIEGLRKALLAGTVTDQHALSLMQRQYKAMDEYAYTLMARLRYLGVIDTETPLTVREERGVPACVEVTVSAPAGKRAEVKMMHPRSINVMNWTVTEGQSQSWSVAAEEVVTVSQADTSTVAHKRPAG